MDRLGSARVVVNSTGGVVEESDFLPYGTERVITDNLDNTYKFTGHERDTESGLDHTLYRKLSSNLGRWLSPDPARCNPSNPQGWNRYSYTAGNPVNRVDPTGAIALSLLFDLAFGLLYDPYYDPYGYNDSICRIGTGLVVGRRPGLDCGGTIEWWNYVDTHGGPSPEMQAFEQLAGIIEDLVRNNIIQAQAVPWIIELVRDFIVAGGAIWVMQNIKEIGRILQDVADKVGEDVAIRKYCGELLVDCLENPDQPEWNQGDFGKKKDCGACFRECVNEGGVWPEYKCPK